MHVFVVSSFTSGSLLIGTHQDLLADSASRQNSRHLEIDIDRIISPDNFFPESACVLHACKLSKTAEKVLTLQTKQKINSLNSIWWILLA